MGKQWFVARIKPSKEITASVSVVSLGFDVFLPVTPVRRRHAGKIETVNRPLFPRYLFISFDAKAKAHGRINNCRGVANRGLIVDADGKPIAVPDAVIRQIRERESAMLAKVGEVTTGYVPGETFPIPRGAFAALVATYMGEENGKVWVTVEIFGGDRIVVIDFEDVPPKAIDRCAA